mgnify:CR=1 FL=1
MVVPLLASSPIAQQQSSDSLPQTNAGSTLENISPIKNDSAQGNSIPLEPAMEENNCKVMVQIHWPSKVRQKQLRKELSSLGKMLCRGTSKQIAKAAWRCTELQQNFLEEIAKQIHIECGAKKKQKRR